MRSALLVALVACGGGQHAAAVSHDSQAFDCRERTVSYTVTHGISADELGVQLDCSDGPKIKRWKVDRKGKRLEDSRVLSAGEFEDIWKQVDGTGWTNLHDCTNGTGAKSDPIFTFDIKDDQNKASFACQARTMPYPYNDFVDPLDAAAAQGKAQLGDETQ
jgi:hypothetical protein